MFWTSEVREEVASVMEEVVEDVVDEIVSTAEDVTPEIAPVISPKSKHCPFVIRMKGIMILMKLIMSVVNF